MNDSYQIIIDDLSLKVDIGILKREVGHPQTVLINAVLTLALPPDTDEIGAVLNYHTIVTRIKDLAASRRFNLVESLCRQILDICIDQPTVSEAMVTVQKPDIYADCKAIGCRMQAVRPLRAR